MSTNVTVTKLKIESFSDSSFAMDKLKNSIELLINPENYSQSYKIDYDNPNVIGDSKPTLYFSGMGSNSLVLKKLLIDGTGITTLGIIDVEAYIGKLSKVLYVYVPQTHEPPFVKVSWGALTFKGVCTAFDVNYTLFKPNGKVLRAFVDITFKSTTAPKEKEKEKGKQSADLTHVRTVQAGDTLPLMAYKIYGDSSYYLEIARINKLSSINSIKPGDHLYFPPLKK